MLHHRLELTMLLPRFRQGQRRVGAQYHALLVTCNAILLAKRDGPGREHFHIESLAICHLIAAGARIE
jgi:hypothetical protein